MVNIIKPNDLPEYSLVCMFSRLWVLKKWFEEFSKLEIDKEKTELIFYTDSLEPDLYKFVTIEAKKLTDFNGVRVIWGRNGELTYRAKDSRIRICKIHEELKKYIDGNKLIMIEDDTVVPPDGIIKLIRNFNMLENVAFVQGIEVGRRAYRNYGSWQEAGATVYTDPPRTGLYEINGGGFYCFITNAKLYKEHNFLSYQKTIYEPFGPDFYFVNKLTKKGYKAFTNWSIKCRHLYYLNGMIRSIDYSDANMQAIFIKKGETWQHETKPIKH